MRPCPARAQPSKNSDQAARSARSSPLQFPSRRWRRRHWRRRRFDRPFLVPLALENPPPTQRLYTLAFCGLQTGGLLPVVQPFDKNNALLALEKSFLKSRFLFPGARVREWLRVSTIAINPFSPDGEKSLTSPGSRNATASLIRGDQAVHSSSALCLSILVLLHPSAETAAAFSVLTPAFWTAASTAEPPGDFVVSRNCCTSSAAFVDICSDLASS